MNNNSKTHSTKLQAIIDQQQFDLLKSGLKGIEKESLRISAEGRIAQTNHPVALGSALTHPHITTDYSEALLEFITPPLETMAESLDFLQHIHQLVYSYLDDEMLLAVSMPCGLNGDESVRIAEYGSSNIGQMKHVYRKGLGYRYGRSMQAIAGVHFNYSIPEGLWPFLHQWERSVLTLNDYISEAYFALIRNFQRESWLILYLFGASPAICKNFFKTRPHLMKDFDEFDAYTLYHPYATSLRMSDIGYKSKNQANLKIDYNSLTGYVDSLSAAINTPFPEYEQIGIKVGDEYRQLNANILQIENEFYSTIRPKQIAYSGEKPTLALKRRGVRYVEVRSLDLNPFVPIGIDEETGLFLEVFLLHCLLQDSNVKTDEDRTANNDNQLLVAHQGRKPQLQLNRCGRPVELKDWALEILSAMRPICDILDRDSTQSIYTDAWHYQLERIHNPDLTPSAKILATMSENRQPFGQYGLSTSTTHRLNFKRIQMDSSKKQYWHELSTMSHAKQQKIELSDRQPFDLFLQDYFAQ